MSRRQTGGAGVDRAVFRTELMRADHAALAGVELGAVPGGDTAWWGLWIDEVLVASTDERLMDQDAVAWARRMLGEGVTFLPGHDRGGYWVAGPTIGLDACLSAHPQTCTRAQPVPPVRPATASAAAVRGRWSR